MSIHTEYLAASEIMMDAFWKAVDTQLEFDGDES